MVTMGYVWDRTVETLGERLSVVLPIALLGIFLPSALLASVQGLRTADGSGVAMTLSLLSLAFSLLSLWAQLAIVAAAVDPRRALGAAARVGTRRLLPAVGVFLLIILAGLALSIPLIVLMSLGGIDAAAMQTGQVVLSRLSPGMIGVATLYAVLVAIVLLFVGARLAPLLAVVAEERRGAGAIAHSFRLTRRLTWRLAGVVLLYVILVTVATLAAQTVFGTVLKLFDGGTGPVTVTRVGTAIATSAVSTAFSVLATIFCARLYVAVAGTAGGAIVAQAPAQAAPFDDAPDGLARP